MGWSMCSLPGGFTISSARSKLSRASGRPPLLPGKPTPMSLWMFTVSTWSALSQSRLLSPAHPKIADTCVGLGRVHESAGEHDEALARFKRALHTYRAVYGAGHRRTTKLWAALLRVRAKRDRYGC